MERGAELAVGKWSAPECPFRIEYNTRVLEEIRLSVVDAFFSLPRGGAEIGGILLGGHQGDRIAIHGFEPLDCEHAMGPSFLLSPRDQSLLAQLTTRAAGYPRDLQPIGWYHSHTRSEIFLSETDQDIHKRFFPEPWQIALVLKPHTFEPTRGGFFFREHDGSIRGAASYQEFVLEPRTVGPTPVPKAASANPPSPFTRMPPASSAPALPPSYSRPSGMPLPPTGEPPFPVPAARVNPEPKPKPPSAPPLDGPFTRATLAATETLRSPAVPRQAPPVQPPAEPLLKPRLTTPGEIAASSAVSVETVPLKPQVPARSAAPVRTSPLVPASRPAPASPASAAPKAAPISTPRALRDEPVVRRVEEPAILIDPPELEVAPRFPRKKGVPITREIPSLEPAVATETPAIAAAAPQFGQYGEQRKSGVFKVAAYVAIGLAVAGVGYQTRDSWLTKLLANVNPAPKDVPATLSLTLTDTNGQLNIRWDRKSAAVSGALEASLQINDGNLPPRSLKLDASQLASGAISYGRQSDHVEVILVTTETGGQVIREQSSFVAKNEAPRPAPPPPSSGIVQKERDDLAAKNQQLQKDLSSQSSKLHKTEKELKDLREQLLYEQRRRLGSQSPAGKKN